MRMTEPTLLLLVLYVTGTPEGISILQQDSKLLEQEDWLSLEVYHWLLNRVNKTKLFDTSGSKAKWLEDFDMSAILISP